MFTMPAIHHSSVKVEDASMGTMHLNALNGSSNVLNYNDSENSNHLGQSGVFGGLIGVSLSENHPYRPHDCGMTFYKTSKFSHKKSVTTTSSITSTTPASHNRSLSNTFQLYSKCPNDMSCSQCSEMSSPTGPRRHSLDLDLISPNTHRRHRDRSFSLDELVIGPFSRMGPFPDDAIDELEHQSDLDPNGLSLTEVSINTSDIQDSSHITDTTSQTSQTVKKNKKTKKKRSQLTDLSVSEKAVKLLEKIKDSRKDHNSNFKHNHHTSKVNTHQQSTTASSTDNVRHNILHLLFTSGQQKPDQCDL